MVNQPQNEGRRELLSGIGSGISRFFRGLGKGPEEKHVEDETSLTRRDFVRAVGAAGAAAAMSGMLPGSAEAQEPPEPNVLAARLGPDDRTQLQELAVSEQDFVKMCLQVRSGARSFHTEVQPRIVERLKRMANGGGQGFDSNPGNNLSRLRIAAQDIVSGLPEPDPNAPAPP